MKKTLIILALVILVSGIVYYYWHQNRKSNHNERATDTTVLEQNYEVATFAGGCFWCTESDFEKVRGVEKAVSGFIGGSTVNPAYKDISTGTTGHREASQVFYDSNIVTYAELLDVFWTHVNPTDEGGQFGDRGFQYSTAIFYYNEEQRETAEASKADLDASGQLDAPIVTPIIAAAEFYIAEDYHQDYYVKNPIRYNYYRQGSGRNTYITNTWGDVADDVIHGKTCVTNICQSAMKDKAFVKPSDAELKEILTPIQYKVTQHEGTERPFNNEYWDNHEEGIYVDIVSGEALFSSNDKFDSGTGWPSFLKPIDYSYVTEHDDFKLFSKRTEIRSVIADSHLGHIILDGPESNDKIRYCMNSASMKFIPKEELKDSKYEVLLEMFR